MSNPKKDEPSKVVDRATDAVAVALCVWTVVVTTAVGWEALQWISSWVH